MAQSRAGQPASGNGALVRHHTPSLPCSVGQGVQASGTAITWTRSRSICRRPSHGTPPGRTARKYSNASNPTDANRASRALLTSHGTSADRAAASSHRRGHWFDPSIAHARFRRSEAMYRTSGLASSPSPGASRENSGRRSLLFISRTSFQQPVQHGHGRAGRQRPPHMEGTFDERRHARANTLTRPGSPLHPTTVRPWSSTRRGREFVS
jgi:hypothetical protein